MHACDFDHCSSEEGKILFSLCKTADTPYSLKLWLLFKYELGSYFDATIDPTLYDDPDTFRLDYQCLMYLQKWKYIRPGIDLGDVAIQKFKTSEIQCRATNERIRLASVNLTDFEPEIFRMQRKIANLLGPFSLFKLDDHFGWGKGATFELPRRYAQIDRKITELPMHISANGKSLFKSIVETDLHWSAAILGVMPSGPYSLLRSVFESQDKCRVTTVPKNAKTDRVIAIEPRGSLFLQKGVGGYFSSRLKTVGVTLDNQEQNQFLAGKAITRLLATLDMRAASDTVSKELIYLLFPIDWAIFLDSLRSRQALMPDGSVIELEKFSSMGNGFTFELESIIFWACLMASSDEGSIHMGFNASIYGDDIICPRGIAGKLINLLGFLGFEINMEKSFVDGPFFESCGKHYFLGFDVTPALQKERILDIHESIRASNRLLRAANRAGYDLWICRKYFPAWAQSTRSFGKYLRLYQLPNGADGDDGYLLPYEDFVRTPSFSRRTRYHGYFCCSVVASKVSRVPAHEEALLALTMRRGVVTDDPFMGNISTTSAALDPKRVYRSLVRPVQFRNIWQ